MNNKRIGTAFENEVVQILKDKGFWVHFISPNNAGAQPFDIIAVKDGRALAIDCKTCIKNTFSISRLEDNQVFAFDAWMKCDNGDPLLAVKYDGRIYMVSYKHLKKAGKIRLKKDGDQLPLYFLLEK